MRHQNINNMKFPETAMRLRAAMDKIGITAQELSKRSGVGKSSISHYVNGTHEPHNENAGKIAKVLDVNPMWLMGFDVPLEEESTMNSNNLDSYFINNYSKLTPEHQALVDSLIKLLRQEQPDSDKVLEMIGRLSAILHS